MADCCNDKACEIDALKAKQTSTLKVVLGINAVMFGVELGGGIAAGSVSLVADSLDMLGDALVYGFSLYAVARGAREKAFSALLKGGIMTAFGLMVLAQAAYRMFHPETPVVELIGGFALLALVANGLCLAMLWSHREDDINMSSVWLCSRNDIIANVSVLIAAVGVWTLHSAWPDIIVGAGLAGLFFRSATTVVRSAVRELRAAPPRPSIQALSLGVSVGSPPPGCSGGCDTSLEWRSFERSLSFDAVIGYPDQAMLKKSFIVLLLLITPFAQARAMLICSMMNDQVIEHCCCPGHAGPAIPMQSDVSEGACCDVVIEVSDKDFAGVGTDLPTVKRPGHDVPDLAVVVTPIAVIPTVFATALPGPYAGTLSFPPPRLYLRTARLRL
jgi:Co/Zn/Cd efflux system component